jgi:hypothetical protein
MAVFVNLCKAVARRNAFSAFKVPKMKVKAEN